MNETTPKSKFSPGLLLFLAFPLLGIAAAFLMAGAEAPRGTLASTPVNPIAPRLDWQAPNFELTLLDGTPVQLTDYRGRIVFLNFWATNCAPCREELPAFQRFISEQSGEAGAVVLAVNIGETVQMVEGFFTENGISGIPVVMDPVGLAQSLYGVINMPTTYVIDEQGMNRDVHYGAMTLEQMYNYLNSVRAAQS